MVVYFSYCYILEACREKVRQYLCMRNSLKKCLVLESQFKVLN